MDQRKILITGVSRGLGRAMTEEFIRLGHRVAGCARSPQAVAELSERFPEPHRFDVVDVSNDAQVAGWANLVIRKLGAPDLLLNNAGVINDNASLWNVPPDEFSKVIDVNIKGVYHVVRHFVPAMIERETGIIINFSSGWGRSTSPMVAPYCATKWAIEGLTRALADDLPYGMAAIPLNPGLIHTDMLDSCFGKNAAAYPRAEQWAQKAVPFLLDLGPEDNGDPLTAPA
ncbi:MAG: SDR family oxidoreductase [Planctomycetia bacterium]|nr:SDR family oxidoreductase [Planctomycetia bacterium]